MFKAIKEFFTGKPAEVVAEVPYKVETPVVAAVEGAGVVDTVVIVPVAVAEAAPVTKPRVKKASGPRPAVKKPRKTK
jgi:hypothetical protein